MPGYVRAAGPRFDLVERAAVVGVRDVQLPRQPGEASDPFTATELTSRLNGKNVPQSTSAENWSIHVSVPEGRS